MEIHNSKLKAKEETKTLGSVNYLNGEGLEYLQSQTK